MKKINKVLKQLSELYEFNRRIKDYKPKERKKAGRKSERDTVNRSALIKTVHYSARDNLLKRGPMPHRKGAEMMFKRVDHVEIVPGDAEKTIEFYVNILSFRIKSRNEVKRPPMREVIYLELGDTVIEVISADNPKPKSENPWEVGYRGIALEVEDMAKAVDYLKDKGIDIVKEPVDLGDSLRGEIRDPDGLIIELRQWK